MPKSKLELENAGLGEAAQRFLESKRPSTKKAYGICLKRFQTYYGDRLEGFIGEIEGQVEANEGKPLAQRVRPGEATMRGFIRWHEEKGYAPKSTRQSLAALQNALKYYGVSVSLDFIELPPDRALGENAKHPWTLLEMKQFVDGAEYLRDKAFILVAFQSGLGLGDIVALNYRDIKREYEAGTLPLALHLFRKKTGVEIRTFLGRDAVHYLRMYLNTRPGLGDGAPLFTMLGSERRVTEAAIQKMLREYAGKMPFILDEDVGNGSFNPARPHSLRSAFRSRLTGKMDDTLIEFLMGHSIGDRVKTYINMPLDELREIYANYEHLLTVEKTSRNEKAEESPQVTEAAFKRLEQEVGQLVRRNAELEEARRGQDVTVQELEAEMAALKEAIKMIARAQAEREQ